VEIEEVVLKKVSDGRPETPRDRVQRPGGAKRRG
jgi:hypothetical protein